MAKKSRRSRREAPKPSVTRQQSVLTNVNAPAATVSAIAPKQSSQAEMTSKKGPDFSQEYHYVISDLKRVGILAAVLLAGLIVLSIVL